MGERDGMSEKDYMIFFLGIFNCWESSSMCTPLSRSLQTRTHPQSFSEVKSREIHTKGIN